MITWKHTIRDMQGLHARPAARIAAAVMKYRCRVMVSGAKKKADAKNLMELMDLNAAAGEVLTFTFQGEDEEEASGQLKDVLIQVNL